MTEFSFLGELAYTFNELARPFKVSEDKTVARAYRVILRWCGH